MRAILPREQGAIEKAITKILRGRDANRPHYIGKYRWRTLRKLAEELAQLRSEKAEAKGCNKPPSQRDTARGHPLYVGGYRRTRGDLGDGYSGAEPTRQQACDERSQDGATLV